VNARKDKIDLFVFSVLTQLELLLAKTTLGYFEALFGILQEKI